MTVKRSLLTVALILLGQHCIAQETTPSPPKDDWKPATTNQPGKEYPQVNSEGRVKFRIVAPQAQSVRVSFRDSSAFTKGEDGAGSATRGPWTKASTITRSTIDGAEVPDPRQHDISSARIAGAAASKSPPRIRISMRSRTCPTGNCGRFSSPRRAPTPNAARFVYTPPDYDKDPTSAIRCLYLQHGWGENEYGWGVRAAPI